MAVINAGGADRTACFRNEFFFLSSMYPTAIQAGEFSFSSSEQAFQMRKTILPEERELIYGTKDPGESRSRGRKCPIRPDWEKLKKDHMHRVTFHKFFQDPELKERLLATGNLVLEEGNTWGDLTWGVDLRTRKGENLLGKTLMSIRSELSKENPAVPSLIPSFVRLYPFISLRTPERTIWDRRAAERIASTLRRTSSGGSFPDISAGGCQGGEILLFGTPDILTAKEFQDDAGRNSSIRYEELLLRFSSLFLRPFEKEVRETSGSDIEESIGGVILEKGFFTDRILTVDLAPERGRERKGGDIFSL